MIVYAILIAISRSCCWLIIRGRGRRALIGVVGAMCAILVRARAWGSRSVAMAQLCRSPDPPWGILRCCPRAVRPMRSAPAKLRSLEGSGAPVHASDIAGLLP